MAFKKISFFALLTVFISFLSCGPAAEDRATMVARSKVVQDSIANVIRMAIAEAEAPGPNTVVTQSPAATATTANVPK